MKSFSSSPMKLLKDGKRRFSQKIREKTGNAEGTKDNKFEQNVELLKTFELQMNDLIKDSKKMIIQTKSWINLNADTSLSLWKLTKSAKVSSNFIFDMEATSSRCMLEKFHEMSFPADGTTAKDYFSLWKEHMLHYIDAIESILEKLVFQKIADVKEVHFKPLKQMIIGLLIQRILEIIVVVLVVVVVVVVLVAVVVVVI